jgi:Family of unknown function (DUF5762)
MSEKVQFDLSNVEIETFNNSDNEKKQTIPFWSNDPNILFQQPYMFEFFPVESMMYEQKLNAVSRSVVLMTVIFFVISRSIRLLIIGAITLGAIFLLYYYHTKEKDKTESKKLMNTIKEGFDSSVKANPTMAYLKNSNIAIPDDVFDTPTSTNPFDNVLITDYDYNPDKKPAPPSFNSNISADIMKQAKQLVSEANPDQPDITDKLFSSLGDQLIFEQSLRPFHSNPATTIPNDQKAFADFCYGSMVSNKEGNAFAAARNLSHYTLY